MAAPIEFHFDFISPYGWFASHGIEAVAARHGRTVDWRPMLLGVAVLKVMGLKPLLDTPLKGAYVRRDVKRQARRLGLHLGRDLDAPMGNPLVPARAVCWAKQHAPQHQAALVHALYAAYWESSCDFATPEELRWLRLPPGLDAAALAAGAAGDEAAAALRASVAASLAAGVFGSPTIVVDDEPFWGSDRLGDVDDWLAGGGW